MATAKTKKLACGGVGPCCHIGYAHRHCEHCDVVVDTRPANWWYQPWNWPLPTTVRPHQPFYNTVGDVANTQTNMATWQTALASNAAASSYDVKPLPGPTVAHACEVK